MAEVPGLKTYANHANSATNSIPPEAADTPRTQAPPWRTLLFIGLAAASAGLAYAVVRATLSRPPSDPTTERIQQLIDEANRLLKQLDEKKPD